MEKVVRHEYAPVGGGEGAESTHIKVYLRARPNAEAGLESDFMQVDDEDKRKITIKDPKNADSGKHSEVAFQFDHIFWTDEKQDVVFDNICNPQVNHVLQGYNCCSFACECLRAGLSSDIAASLEIQLPVINTH